MKELVKEIEKLIIDSSQIIGKPILKNNFQIIDRGCPHRQPQSLPSNKMAVYMFKYNNIFLKIGKANKKSNARYVSMHYCFSAPSTLAKSILKDKDNYPSELNENNIKDWMLKNLQRIDILIDANLGYFVLEFIEVILHYKYQPKYEGSEKQRK